jgi:hypothetical protein
MCTAQDPFSGRGIGKSSHSNLLNQKACGYARIAAADNSSQDYYFLIRPPFEK